jgi:pyruvate formate lyase activating enzyme
LNEKGVEYILKGVIFDIKRFCTNDGPGIRTAVFFKGCPLDCWWCHNPEGRTCEIEKAVRVNKIGDMEFYDDEDIGKESTVDDVMDEVVRDIIVYEESGGGVTFTGGEPFYQFEFLKELLKESKARGINTALDTSGYTSKENIEDILDFVDLFLYDIKHLEDSEHIKYTGVSNAIILENLSFLIGHKKKIILRFPVIPGINDTRKNINKLKAMITLYKEDLHELHLLPFHSIADSKYKKLNTINKLMEINSINERELHPLKEEFEKLGIKVKIGG